MNNRMSYTRPHQSINLSINRMSRLCLTPYLANNNCVFFLQVPLDLCAETMTLTEFMAITEDAYRGMYVYVLCIMDLMASAACFDQMRPCQHRADKRTGSG